MTTSLLLLDLCGTVRTPISGGEWINSPEDQSILPQALVALDRFASIGAIIVGVTNESGVAAGYLTLGECIDKQLRTMELAPQIKAIFFSPDSDGSRCFYVRHDGKVLTIQTDDLKVRSFRKPACGMLIAAMGMFGAKAEDTLMVGDRDEDRSAALSCGCDYIPAECWWATEQVTKLEEAA